MRDLIITLAMVIYGGICLQAQDVSESEDHPLITRYPGATIAWYEEQAFEPYSIAIGPQTGYKTISDWKEVKGKLTRIFYSIPGARSVSEVHLNYENALNKGGFSFLAKGLNKARNVGKQVGDRTWMGTAYAKNPLPPNGDIPLFHGTSTSGGTGYLAGELKRASGNVYVTIASYQYSETEVVVLVDIVETQPMEDDLVSVDPDAMSGAIDRDGKVAIYGLHFDFDKATLKPESKPVLEAIAAVLKKRPQLKVYVVGHTDMKGTLTYNLTLSESRAQAVVDALVKNHGISRARLSPKGVGPLVPVSTNTADTGRKLNRRVELVQQ
ncbi:MAG: OmpA family protein [Bacteroidota bacterium]